MKSRDAYLAVLLGLLSNFLFALFVQPWIEPLKRAWVDIVPWVENLLSQPRDRLERTVGAILALSILLLGLLRRRARAATVLPLSGASITASIASGSLSALPAGAAAATVMAMLPVPQCSPQLVNNSIMMQWWQHDHAARYATHY